MVFSLIKSWDQIDGFCKEVTETDKLIAVLITLGFYILFVCLSKVNEKIQPSRWIAILGGMSYPLYLIHSRAGLELVDSLRAPIGVYAALCSGIIVVLFVSLCVHLFVEKPLFKRARALVS